MLTDAPRPGGTVRRALLADLPKVAEMCAAHAAFEGAGPVPADLATRLESALLPADPRAWCFVGDHEGELTGYATCSLEFSTWQASDYIHLDCLFVTETHRGEGWGRRLLDAVTRTAAARSLAQVQWQTPEWNADAIRFYTRAGAQASPKVRFSLPVQIPSGRP
ncbi:GNAT family N-acetyltransferase [Streptomyces sp. NPDC005576]|uniref:GNAT family N-acetyltransferase n=1 Tax=Streptomyces sp. NPDC005576 TaxID=3364726 RepID=UPI0036844538